jgi:DNA invertase Pin-like site-specific DNA recombinase
LHAAGKVVVVCDLARLTRSESDQAELLAKFRRAGVSLVTVSHEDYLVEAKKAGIET